MRVLAIRAPARCAVCHDALDGLALQGACPRCGARGHLPCMGDLGRCPTLGCARPGWTGVPAAPAPSPADDRRGRADPAATASGAFDRPLRETRWALAAVAGLVVGVGLLLVNAPGVLGQGHTARVERVRADLRAIVAACELFRLDHGRLPRTLDELWVRPDGAHGWEPYLPEGPPRDPWGSPYDYAPPPRGAEGTARFEVRSWGADGVPGGADEAADHCSCWAHVEAGS